MKVYIAGKITGSKDYKKNFGAAAAALEAEGHIALNPATLPEGMTEKDYMGICFAMIDAADVVVLLPDAHLSKGAMLEMMYCQYIGKPVRELEGWQWAKSN